MFYKCQKKSQLFNSYLTSMFSVNENYFHVEMERTKIPWGIWIWWKRAHNFYQISSYFIHSTSNGPNSILSPKNILWRSPSQVGVLHKSHCLLDTLWPTIVGETETCCWHCLLLCSAPILPGFLICTSRSTQLFAASTLPNGGTRGKESACECRRHKRCGFDPWVGKIPWRAW